MEKFFNKIAAILTFDIDQAIQNFWSGISPVSKKAFLWTFIIVNIVFLWHTISFLPDNHSLRLLYGLIDWKFQWEERIGRFSGGWLQQIFDGEIFPVVNSIVCYFGFILAMIHLANYWQLPKTVLFYTLFSLFVILMPYTLPWIYFIRHATYFWNIFFIIYGLTLLLKPTFIKVIMATILFVISLGAYIAMFQILALFFLGRCIVEILSNNYNIFQIIKEYRHTFYAVLLTLIIFISIEFYLRSIGLLGNRDAAAINFVPNLKQIKLVLLSFGLPMIHLPIFFRIMLFFPILLTLLYFIFEKRIILILLSFISIISANLINLFSEHNYIFTVRVNFFGMPWLYALFCIVLIKYKPMFKNIIMLLCCSSVFFSAIQDLKWQKSFVYSAKREIEIYHNINEKIRSHKNFTPNKKYVLLQFGELNTRKMFDRNYREWPGKNHYVTSSLNPYWDSSSIFSLFEKENYISGVHKVNADFVKEHINDIDINYLIKNANAYPKESYVNVEGKYIYLVFSTEILKIVKSKIINL